MPFLKTRVAVSLLCGFLLVGCRGDSDLCPKAFVDANPAEIPAGTNQTNLSVQVSDPSLNNGFDVITELSATSGAFADPFARETTYACAHDVSGPVEICVKTTYQDDSGAGETVSEVSDVEASREYLRGPNAYLSNPLECSTTLCITIECPKDKNICPEVSSLTIDPEVVSEGENATITVVAVDPDDNPETLVTTLSARHGTIADSNARSTTYACDPEVGGVVEICVLASDGDSSCDVEHCTSGPMPGRPAREHLPDHRRRDGNSHHDSSRRDHDHRPRRCDRSGRLSRASAHGVELGDGCVRRSLRAETTFTCGDSGPVEICGRANDGDPKCDETRCMTVQCPSDIPANLCPQLFVINGVPRVIPEGQTTTLVQTRGQDTDGLPSPLDAHPEHTLG